MSNLRDPFEFMPIDYEPSEIEIKFENREFSSHFTLTAILEMDELFFSLNGTDVTKLIVSELNKEGLSLIREKLTLKESKWKKSN